VQTMSAQMRTGWREGVGEHPKLQTVSATLGCVMNKLRDVEQVVSICRG
jgi:hypothetical protein